MGENILSEWSDGNRLATSGVESRCCMHMGTSELQKRPVGSVSHILYTLFNEFSRPTWEVLRGHSDTDAQGKD